MADPRVKSPRPDPDRLAFRALRAFNDPQVRVHAGSRARVDARTAARMPPGSLVQRVVAALAAGGLLPLKEVCESFEFFERARTSVRAPAIADLAAGHGLTGLLFGLFERQVEQVILVDTHPSPSHQHVLDALCEVGPWLRPKVRWVTGRIEQAHTHLEDGTSILAVHACGERTDRCMDVALACGGHMALMPCCYPKSGEGSPALFGALGEGLAMDIHRTYRMEAAGYQTRWTHIPRVITPMNRILIGKRPDRRPSPTSVTDIRHP